MAKDKEEVKEKEEVAPVQEQKKEEAPSPVPEVPE